MCSVCARVRARCPFVHTLAGENPCSRAICNRRGRKRGRSTKQTARCMPHTPSAEPQQKRVQRDRQRHAHTLAGTRARAYTHPLLSPSKNAYKETDRHTRTRLHAPSAKHQHAHRPVYFPPKPPRCERHLLVHNLDRPCVNERTIIDGKSD